MPFEDDLIYDEDRVKVYKYGGRWCNEDKAFVFNQLDIEAYINVLNGQWILIDP